MRQRPAPVLMVLGTASSAGKSVLVTALCRIFRQDGVRVAPFKAQNMSNNADVTPSGGEIGRAQAEQAAAAGLVPTVQMNPVLLKPQGDRTSQVVVEGRASGLLGSAEFLERKRDLWPHVEHALASLRGEYDLVVAEGAGSPAEPNLRAADIVNMRVALHAGATVLLVGDIDRGGVFAHLLGTMELLTPEERALVRGFVINRFRGDASLLAPAIEDLERRTGVPVLGVVPWLPDLRVAQEDAVVLERDERAPRTAPGDGEVDVAVVRLPRIANFDDFDPLAAESGVRVRYVARPEDLGAPSLLILPGTKATIADLEAIRASGLAAAIAARARSGTPVLGICGGYQMLGERLRDPLGVEAAPGSEVAGLGLLPLVTTFAADKVTRRAVGHVLAAPGLWGGAADATVEGYEIHMGRTEPVAGAERLEPLLQLEGREDGAVGAGGHIAGCYLHGLFHNDEVRHGLLLALGWRGGEHGPARFDREREFDRLAQHVRSHLDVERVRALVFGERTAATASVLGTPRGR